jgi:hypothetical protein
MKKSILGIFLTALLISTATLFVKSNNYSSLGPSFSSIINSIEPEDNMFTNCPSVILQDVDIDVNMYGWPFGVAEITVYENTEIKEIATCQGYDGDNFYPLSFLVNTLIFASMSYVVYMLFKRFKKRV